MDTPERTQGQGAAAWPRTAAAFVGLTLAYALLAGVGLRWAVVPGAGTPVWPAAGMALAGLLLFGLRLWPAVFLGRLLAFLADDGAQPWGVVLALCAGNTLMAVAGAWGLRRWGRVDPALPRLRDMAWLLGWGALGSTLPGAVLGVGTLVAVGALGPAPSAGTLLSMWAGAVAGVAVVAPLVLAWARPEAWALRARDWAHLAAVLAACVGLGWLVFAAPPHVLVRHWLVFPALVWAALAFQVRGAALAMAVMGVLVVLGATWGRGTLVEVPEVATRFMLVQGFVAVASASTLVLAVVADERRARFALQRHEALLGTVLDALPAGVIIADADGRLVRMNAANARLWGAAPRTRSIAEYAAWTGYWPETGERIAARDWPLARALEHGEVTPGRLVDIERFGDGARRQLLLSAAPVRDARGAVTAGVVASLDVTEQLQAQAALRASLEEQRRQAAALQEAVQARNVFLSVAAHELKTPLTTLTMRLELLRRDAEQALREGGAGAAAGGVVRGLDAADAQVRRLTGLVQSLLDVSRLATGRLVLHPEEVDLAQLLQEVAGAMRPVAEAAGSALEVHAEGRAVGRFDRLRLEQVVTNLLSNAVKFGKGRPIRVHLTAEAGGTRARLAVQDAGIGVAPEAQARIFERFERAVSDRHYGGLGLGLYITRELVQAMGGSVGVQSAPGEGATFTVELPLGGAPPS